MGLFDQFPYTNFHELNLDWILMALKELEHTIDQFVSINALKYADPIQWNITSQYEKNTIVIDPQTGTAYISVQPVPSGVIITNTDYWSVVFDLGAFVTRTAQNFTNRYEEATTLTATFASGVNDWLIWGDKLYRVLSPIIAGDQYVVGSNIEHFTLESIIGHIEDLTTTDKSNLVAAINEVLTTLINTTGDLADLDTVDKSNLVAAINEVLQTLADKVGDLNDLDTTDKSNIVAAINDELSYLKSIAVNVALEGADTTGATDCSGLIQSLANDYDVLYFPTGIYKIDTPITIPKHISLVGDNATIQCKTHGFIINNAFSGIIAGLNFTGNKILTNVFITLNSCKFFKIFNCQFKTCGYGINTYLSQHIDVSNCYFNDLHYGVVFDGLSKSSSDNAYNSVRNCYLNDTISEAIYFRFCQSSEARNNSTNNTGSFGIGANLCKFITIDGNTTYMSAGEGLNLQDCEECIISKNYCYWDPSDARYGVSRGVDFGVSIWGTNIDGNISAHNKILDNWIEYSYKTAIALSDNTQWDIISGNSIINCATNTTLTDQERAGIGAAQYMSGGINPSAGIIINNIIAGKAKFGIYLTVGQHWDFKVYNNIMESVTIPLYGYAIPSDDFGYNSTDIIDTFTPVLTNADLVNSSFKYIINNNKVEIGGYIELNNVTGVVTMSLPFNVYQGELLGASIMSSLNVKYKMILENPDKVTIYDADTGSNPPAGSFQFTLQYNFK